MRAHRTGRRTALSTLCPNEQATGEVPRPATTVMFVRDPPRRRQRHLPGAPQRAQRVHARRLRLPGGGSNRATRSPPCSRCSTARRRTSPRRARWPRSANSLKRRASCSRAGAPARCSTRPGLRPPRRRRAARRRADARALRPAPCRRRTRLLLELDHAAGRSGAPLRRALLLPPARPPAKSPSPTRSNCTTACGWRRPRRSRAANTARSHWSTQRSNT